MNQPFTSFSDFKRRYPIRPNDTGSLLGSGSYGRVFKVEDQVETEWVAIKISEFKGNDTKSLKAEVDLAQRVPRQGNIARYDACYRLETDTSVSDFAIMKYYPDGNLADLLQRVTLTPPQIYDITQGILLGLQHLHRHRIVHRDFKPANILISRDNAGRFIPKIADFGLSRLVTNDELDNSDFDLSDGRGTPSYKAPEQIEGSRVSFNLDLWAFGVILYEIMTGEKPFRADLRNSSEQSARREIEKKIISVELPERIDEVAEPYASMIRRCLVRDIHERVRKENELLDLLDCIPQMLAKAKTLFDNGQHTEALTLFYQVLDKRENHAEAQKGVDQCQSALGSQQLNQLLSEADNYVTKQQFEQAKAAYEQVLQLDPTQAVAVRGLALCINRLKPPLAEPELTDVYREESTDIYVASPPLVTTERPSSRVVSRGPVALKSSVVSSSLPNELVTQTVVQPWTTKQTAMNFPWQFVIPTAVVVSGFVWYFNFKEKSILPPIGRQEPVEQRAEIGPSIVSKIKEPETNVVKLTPVVGESKNALNKRIDTAMSKARRHYSQGDYESVVMLTNSALGLDPTRKDVVAMRNTANKEIQKKTTNVGKPAIPVTSTPELPKATVSPETEKPKETSANTKQEAQEKYDQLIEDGVKAITNGNNKVKAISDFDKATPLAKEHNLSTAKADEAYNTFLAKANKIFDNEEYDGAKAWYKVAQALKDTEEVRRKIKQCTNQ